MKGIYITDNTHHEKRLEPHTARSIDRLKENRSALIIADVTGQINVSTYAKPGAPARRLDAIQAGMGS